MDLAATNCVVINIFIKKDKLEILTARWMDLGTTQTTTLFFLKTC